MSEKLKTVIAVIGIDIGKNSFHVVGLDERGAVTCVRSGPVGSKSVVAAMTAALQLVVH
jgi:hypothetical protein